MPAHLPQWTDFLLCSQCTKEFSLQDGGMPITLLCGHSICKNCANNVEADGCRHDQNISAQNYVRIVPTNSALLRIIKHQLGVSDNWKPPDPNQLISYLGDGYYAYHDCSSIVEDLSVYLQDIKNGIVPQTSTLTKPMLRKLVTLIQCQMVLNDGCLKALRACHAIGERAATELILAHQNPATLSGNLWTAVRARGCQFLGPAMQEEALKLILLALEDGSELSRKVLVMFVVQKLQQQFPQASKTSIGHVVQLLYRASCFVVKKRESDSSLMKLKEEYRTYPALRREHDTQVVQIAREAGLRIAPDQWSALLYGDQGHKSHMQSIIDKLQSGETLMQCIKDLENAIQKSGKSHMLESLIVHFNILTKITDGSSGDDATQKLDLNFLLQCLTSVKVIIEQLVRFFKNHVPDTLRDEEANAQSAKFKTSFCRDIKSRGRCPRGSSCTFAHTDEELHLYRNKRKKAALGLAGNRGTPPRLNSPAKEGAQSPALKSSNDMSAQPDPSIQNAGQGEIGNIQTPAYYYPAQPHPGNPNTPNLLHHNQQAGQMPMMQYPSPRNMYPYDNYQQAPSPRPIVPVESSMNPLRMQNLASGDHASLRPPNPNMPQFTATLSVQSNPHQNVASQQASNMQRHAQHQFDINTRPPNQANMMPAQRLPGGNHDGMLLRPQHYEQMSGFYPIQPQNDHGVQQRFMTPQPHVMSSMEPASYPMADNPMYRSFGTPVIPSPVPNLYDPNTNAVYPQGSPIPHNMGNPILLAPSPSPGNQQPNQPMYIPVLPVPVAQYQLPQMQPQPQDKHAAPRTTGVMVPKSIGDATMAQLEKRKGEILMLLMQNSKKEEPTVMPSIPQKYDIWKCESYEPFLAISMSTKENIQMEDGINASVDVVAELDTRTKQVTVRGVDDINPSHARDERTLDDEEMYSRMREKNRTNTHLVPSATEDVPQSLQTLSNNLRGPQADDDELIPFTDQPIFSKYGPIARSVRTRSLNSDVVQVNANADVNTRPVAANADSPTGRRTPEDPDNQNAYPIMSEDSCSADTDSLHALSSFPLSTMSDSVTLPTATLNYPSKHSSGLPKEGGEMYMTQAASNSRLLRREQVALQQNQAHADMDDLELTMELQKIELGIQRKRLNNYR